jgi:hypothetical protein
MKLLKCTEKWCDLPNGVDGINSVYNAPLNPDHLLTLTLAETPSVLIGGDAIYSIVFYMTFQKNIAWNFKSEKARDEELDKIMYDVEGGKLCECS